MGYGRNPHVSVAIPIYRAARFFPETAAALARLEPQPDRYIFLENNSVDSTLRKIVNFSKPKEIIRLWFRDDAASKLESPYDLIAIVRQTLLTRLRQLDPDYAIFLDSDVCPLRHDLITRLTRHEADIVGGPYLRPYPQGWYLAALWNGTPFKLRSWPPKMFGRVAAVGGGCMCISRRVINDLSVNFYPVRANESEDYGYCLKASELGYKVYLDASVRLKHYANDQYHVDGKSWRVNTKGERMPFSY